MPGERAARERGPKGAAAGEHLDDSAWARQKIMLAVEAWEERQAEKAKVKAPAQDT